MTNALSSNLMPPPAPNPDPSSTVERMPSPSPMASLPPAPTHQQVVAGIRHFSAMERALVPLLKNPDCGKADLKSQTIDAVTKLVGNGFLSATQGVNVMTTFPSRPYDQRKWLEEHLQNSIVSPMVLLDHHQASHAGQAVDESVPSMDDHSDLVAGLSSKYRGGMNG